MKRPSPRLPYLPHLTLNSERARLTVLYGGLLVVAGALLTGLVYVLVSDSLYTSIDGAIAEAAPGTLPDGSLLVPTRRGSAPSAAPVTPPYSPTYELPAPPYMQPDPGTAVASTQAVSTAAGDAVLSRLLTVTGVSLAIYSVISAALAWWMAGRVLRPVGVIAARARRLSGTNLHERLALEAPPGELKDLADTFDTMLDRIEQLVAARQRFAANAAHELRTPLTVQRTAAEIGLAGDPDPLRVARIRTKLIENADAGERLIEGLLLLAHSGQGLVHEVPVDLFEITASVCGDFTDEAQQRGLVLDVVPLAGQTAAVPATGSLLGDPVLIAHLVRNLLANALRHNHRGGTVAVSTGGRSITVTNTGPVIPPDHVARLFEPFHRATPRRHVSGEGAGLGLSIVDSIARAHGAVVTATADPGGGLIIRVDFPGQG